MNRVSVSWGTVITLVLFGCAGNAHNEADAHGGSGGGTGGAGATGGTAPVNGGGGNGGEAGEATGNAGEGGAGGEGLVDTQLLGASAWDVTLTATYTEREGSSPVVIPVSFAIDGSENSRAIFSGESVSVAVAPLMRDGGKRANLLVPEQTFRLSNLTLQTMSLTAFDDDSDGIADRLEGSGLGAVDQQCADDCPPPLPTDPVIVTLSGKPDRSPPKLGGLPSTALSPLDSVTVLVNEALKSAALTLEGTSTVPLDGRVDGVPQKVLFTSKVLPFGGQWQISGHGEDFAGLPLDLSAATLTTIADPGILTQDGFETEPLASLGAGISRISTSSGLPIPGGDHALFIPPGERARFHLKRTDGSTKASLSVVGLSGARSEVPELGFDAAVIGGTARLREGSAPIAVSVPTTHDTWTKASEPRTFQFELEDAGDDVVVEIRATGGPCGWLPPCAPVGALIIDDLRLE